MTTILRPLLANSESLVYMHNVSQNIFVCIYVCMYVCMCLQSSSINLTIILRTLDILVYQMVRRPNPIVPNLMEHSTASSHGASGSRARCRSPSNKSRRLALHRTRTSSHRWAQTIAYDRLRQLVEPYSTRFTLNKIKRTKPESEDFMRHVCPTRQFQL